MSVWGPLLLCSLLVTRIDPISDTKEGEKEVRLSIRVWKRRKGVLSIYRSEQSDNNGALPLIS